MLIKWLQQQQQERRMGLDTAETVLLPATSGGDVINDSDLPGMTGAGGGGGGGGGGAKGGVGNHRRDSGPTRHQRRGRRGRRGVQTRIHIRRLGLNISYLYDFKTREFKLSLPSL